MSKEPLYPHRPKSRQPQFPHVPKGRQPAEVLPQARGTYFWTAINKGTGEIVEYDKAYAVADEALSFGKEWIRKHWAKGDIALVEVWEQPHRYSEHLKVKPVASVTLGPEPTEKLPQTLPQTGTCYQDAYRFLIKEQEGYLVHGTLFSGGRRMGHAWVETLTGWIWEPETGQFFTAAGFKDAFAPVIDRIYSPEEAAIMLARTKNFGPWALQERARYLREAWSTQTIERLASTEGDPIRKFCCRLCGECAPKELLEEGKLLERMTWLRHHYQEKHPGKWGKMTPMTVTEGEPVSPEYRHLASLVREPLPKEAD
jgi:hypothetical protein